MPRPPEELRRAYRTGRAPFLSSYGWPDPGRSFRRALLGPRAIMVTGGIIIALAVIGLLTR